ncbi:MAG TPA: GNAT family N-acetyltransferase [Terriglobales bacterium]|nr:GNAT family N-acetyltransferase [Terriglobales bacterium]
MTAIVIRQATAADAQSLAALRYQFRHEIGGVLENKNTFQQRCAAWMASRLTADWKCWVAVRDEEIVGQLWLHLIEKMPNCNGAPEQHGYITNFYVRPECRGGVGGRLLQQVLEWLKQIEVDAVILWPSPRSRTLYMRQGFKAPNDILELRGPTVDSRFENIESG